MASERSETEVFQSSVCLGPRASRPQRADRAQSLVVANPFSRFALICGRDARGPRQTLEWKIIFTAFAQRAH